MFRVSIHISPRLQPLRYSRFREQPIKRELAAKTSAKDLIEACGIPHTEIDLILANDAPVDFNFSVDHAMAIEAFGCDEAPAEYHDARLQSRTPRRFALDGHLGKLARHLRLLGLDAAYHPGISDQSLLALAAPDRALLTRDRRLLMHRRIAHGYCPRSTEVETQVRECIRRFQLSTDEFTPFSRCLRCNSQLSSVSKQEIESQLEPLTKRYFERFHRCPGCGRIFWRGSHAQRLRLRVEQYLEIAKESASGGANGTQGGI